MPAGTWASARLQALPSCSRTLAFFVTGTAIIVYSLMGRRTMRMSADLSNLTRDLVFFILFYGIAVSATFYHGLIVLKAVVAIGLLVSYPLYLRQAMKKRRKGSRKRRRIVSRQVCSPAGNGSGNPCPTLPEPGAADCGRALFRRICPGDVPGAGRVAAHLSLIITPIATELPEKINSVIWVGQGKDTLALGNITGAMVFQSCFPVVFGMLFTEWDLQGAYARLGRLRPGIGNFSARMGQDQEIHTILMSSVWAAHSTVPWILHLVFLWKK